MVRRSTFSGLKSVLTLWGVLLALFQGGCLALNNPDATKEKSKKATDTTTITDDSSGTSWKVPKMIEGQVTTVASRGSKIYPAGFLTYYGDPNVKGALIFDPALGLTDAAIASSPQFFNTSASFEHSVGLVAAAIADPNEAGAFFVGGKFSHVDGIPRANLARIKPDGTLDTAWAGETDGFVAALATNGTSLFVAGQFDSVTDGTPHASAKVAKFNAANGLVQTAFTSPFATGEALAVAIFPGGKIAVGGSFSCGGGCDNYLVLNPTTGANTGDGGIGADGTVNAIITTAAMVFVGGAFDNFMGNVTAKLAAIDANNPAVYFGSLAVNGTVHTLYSDGTHCYVGGNFSDIGGTSVTALARVFLATGLVDAAWVPALTGSPMTGGVPFVTAIYASATRVYFQGFFTNVNGNGAPLSSSGVVDKVTGTTNDPIQINYTLWMYNSEAMVNTIAESGGKILRGGGFTSVGGELREAIMEIDLETGEASSWRPVLDVPYILSAVVAGDMLYILGYFSTVDGQPRNGGIAAFDLSSGTPVLAPWTPAPDAPIRGFSVNSQAIYLYGTFTDLNGTARAGFAAYDHGTNVPNAWQPTTDVPLDTSSDGSSKIMAYEDSVYMVGPFNLVNGVARSYEAEVDALTGTTTTAWDPTPIPGSTPPPTVLARVGDRVVIGGNFNWGNPNQFLIATDITTGADLGWAPNPDNVNIRRLKVIGERFYVSGDFTTIAGQARAGFAMFNVSDLSLSSWAPSLTGYSILTSLFMMEDDPDEIIYGTGMTWNNTFTRDGPSTMGGVLKFDASDGTWFAPD